MGRGAGSRNDEAGFSRRAFLKGAGGVAAGSVLGAELAAAARQDAAKGPTSFVGPGKIRLDINGEQRELEVEARTSLLSALRHHLSPPLTGAKEVCGEGNCGACTVLLDGEPVYSCLTLAVEAEGRKVRTVEGLAAGDALSPVQQAMWEKDGLMCGYCTPGFVMSLTACIETNDEVDLDQIKSSCSGNLCRCGTYPHIFEAGLVAAQNSKGGK